MEKPLPEREAFIAACLNQAHYDPATKRYSAKGLLVLKRLFSAFEAKAKGDAAAELVWLAHYLKERQLPAAAQQILEMLFSLTKPSKPAGRGWR